MASEAATEVRQAAEASLEGLGLEGSQKGSVKQLVADLVARSLKATFPDNAELEPLVAITANPTFGDYQCNNAMGIWSKIRGTTTEFRNPNAIGQALRANLPASPLIEETSVAGPGFVNIKLATSWLEKRVMEIAVEGSAACAPRVRVSRAIVDFSSPNIAKEMHVGHLRSTIIGDTLARMLEYCGCTVLRRNHVGDWGTQFGMLIEYLFEQFPNWEDIGEQAIGDLQAFYKAAKQKFDGDPDFKQKAQQAVVRLQGGEEQYRAAWTKICDISRKEFDAVYKKMQIVLEEKGESFYNPYIPGVIEELVGKGLVTESDGAQCIFVPGHKVPLIVVKRDGGYNYASTDLAALWYRLNEEKAEWVVYVTDVGQAPHFDMVFKAAKMAGWLPDKYSKEGAKPRMSHVGFGLVLGSDGKRFRTRSTEVVRLDDLLDEAVARSKAGLVERTEQMRLASAEKGQTGPEWTDTDIHEAAVAMGYGAVKYADLKNNRLTDYKFDYDQMLDARGNTAVYLLYAHARICSIVRKAGKDLEELKKTGAIALGHPSERALAVDIVRFPEMVEAALQDLLPSVLCEYVYNLSTTFSTFYMECQVVGSPEETSRLLLCEATVLIMRQCLALLGITPLYRL